MVFSSSSDVHSALEYCPAPARRPRLARGTVERPGVFMPVGAPDELANVCKTVSYIQIARTVRRPVERKPG